MEINCWFVAKKKKEFEMKKNISMKRELLKESIVTWPWQSPYLATKGSSTTSFPTT